MKFEGVNYLYNILRYATETTTLMILGVFLLIILTLNMYRYTQLMTTIINIEKLCIDYSHLIESVNFSL